MESGVNNPAVGFGDPEANLVFLLQKAGPYLKTGKLARDACAHNAPPMMMTSKRSTNCLAVMGGRGQAEAAELMVGVQVGAGFLPFLDRRGLAVWGFVWVRLRPEATR